MVYFYSALEKTFALYLSGPTLAILGVNPPLIPYLGGFSLRKLTTAGLCFDCWTSSLVSQSEPPANIPLQSLCWFGLFLHLSILG